MTVTDFLHIQENKNGDFHVKFAEQYQGAIIRHLRSEGFGRTKVKGRVALYRRIDGRIEPIELFMLKDFFADFLKRVDISDLPEGVERDDILDAFYRDRPIRNNGILHYHLKDELLEEEQHEYLMKCDLDYAKKNR